MQSCQTITREPEKGDWLRRRWVLQWLSIVPTVPVPFFGPTLERRGKGDAVEKGDRHRAGEISGGFSICSCSEPVPLFHYTKPTSHFSWAETGFCLQLREYLVTLYVIRGYVPIAGK